MFCRRHVLHRFFFPIILCFIPGVVSLGQNVGKPPGALSPHGQSGAKPFSKESPAIPAKNPVPDWKTFTDDDLKSFINEIFLTAQNVPPEIEAAGLRQLASVMVSMDSARALWVYDQAFQAAQMIPVSTRLEMSEPLAEEIVLDESRLDLGRAIDHALALQSLPQKKDSEQPVDDKLTLLSTLARRIPQEDPDGLFQKIAPEIVREDEDYRQTLGLVQTFQRSNPERAQLLFSEALAQFGARSAEDAGFRSFSNLTLSIAATQPELVGSAVDLIMKKADQIDARTSQDESSNMGLPSSSSANLGRLHTQVISQFMTIMKKINPSKANDWESQLKEQQKAQQFGSMFPRPGISVTPGSGSIFNSPNSTAEAPGTARGSSPLVTGGVGPGSRGVASAQPFGVMGSRPMFPVSAQPATAFSQALISKINDAQTASKNNSADFTHRVEALMPSIESEDDPRARAAAWAQVALAFFQMGDLDRGRQYLQESLRRSEQGDYVLMQNSGSPSVFFTMYSATSNAIAKIAPTFPHEAVEAMKSISDPQLRLRAMIDTVRALGIQVSLRSPSYH